MCQKWNIPTWKNVLTKNFFKKKIPIFFYSKFFQIFFHFPFYFTAKNKKKRKFLHIFFFVFIFFHIFNSHLGNDFGIQGTQFGQMVASINFQNFVEKIKKKKYFPKKNCQKNNFLFLVKNHVKSLPDLHFFTPLKKAPKKRRQPSLGVFIGPNFHFQHLKPIFS